MKLRNHLRLFVIVLFLSMATAVVLTRAEANPHPHDEDGGGGDIDITGGDIDITGGDVIGGDLTGGDLIGGDMAISTGGNKSLVIAPPGLGDVDIAQCLGSQAWTLLIGGRQTLVLNQVCMAEFYLKVGRYDLAAQALCNQPGIVDEYSSEGACEIDHDFTPAPDHDIHSRSEEFEAAYEQQEHEIEFLQEDHETIRGRLDALTALLNETPAPAQAPATVYIQQEPEPKYSDEDMAYVLGLYQKGEKDDE
jgi:hypothetical protein